MATSIILFIHDSNLFKSNNSKTILPLHLLCPYLEPGRGHTIEVDTKYVHFTPQEAVLLHVNKILCAAG